MSCTEIVSVSLMANLLGELCGEEGIHFWLLFNLPNPHPVHIDASLSLLLKNLSHVPVQLLPMNPVSVTKYCLPDMVNDRG